MIEERYGYKSRDEDHISLPEDSKYSRTTGLKVFLEKSLSNFFYLYSQQLGKISILTSNDGLDEIKKSFDDNYLVNVIVGEKDFLVHSCMTSLIEELNHSVYILDLDEDWDGMGAEKISKSTYYDAIGFAVDYTKHIFRRYDSQIISAPEINPGPDGSIDLEWHSVNARFLANIQSSAQGTIVKFYGDFHKNSSPYSGKMYLKQFNTELAKWMTSL